jgi:hypothetical protein
MGISPYGKQRVDGRDRKQLERLARYLTRPVIATERLLLPEDLLARLYSRAIPLLGLASCLNRPRIPHDIRLQNPVTSSNFWENKITVHRQPLSIAGVGFSRMCSALT